MSTLCLSSCWIALLYHSSSTPFSSEPPAASRRAGRKRAAETGPRQQKLDYKRATAANNRAGVQRSVLLHAWLFYVAVVARAGDASTWMLGTLKRTLRPCCLSSKRTSSCSGRVRLFFAMMLRPCKCNCSSTSSTSSASNTRSTSSSSSSSSKYIAKELVASS